MGAVCEPPPYIAWLSLACRMYRELTSASPATDAPACRDAVIGTAASDHAGDHGCGAEETMMRVSDLQAFFDHGWNRHDLDVLMTFMADDCVFESTAGAEVCGTRHAGRERVRQAFAKVFPVFPDPPFR